MTQIIDSQLYVYWDNAGSFTDFTREAWSRDTAKTVDFDLDTNKYLYIGKEYTFNHRYFNFKTVQAGATLKVEYYSDNASNWADVTEYIDTTWEFSQDGHVFFELPDDWEMQTVNSKELYWFRISATAPVAGFSLYTIKNLFTDDDSVTEYLPTLTRYLPSGQSDFFYLHETAKNEIINDLKAAEKLDYEDQLKDVSLIVVQQLAIYKFLELLLLPLIEDESIEKMYLHFKTAYSTRLEKVRLSIDTNKDQKVSDSERGKVTFSTISRV